VVNLVLGSIDGLARLDVDGKVTKDLRGMILTAKSNDGRITASCSISVPELQNIITNALREGQVPKVSASE